MASLRTRLLTGVLALSAAGLVAVGAVTYAEQRSFLENRVNQEAISAVPAMSQLLDRAGLVPAGRRSPAPSGEGPGGPRGDEFGGPAPNIPPGTYGQRRAADGTVLGHRLISYAEEPSRPLPQIPASIPVERLFTVGSVGSSGLRYRAYARPDPEDTGLTVVAVPLNEVDETLSRLLLVEGLVIGSVLLALGITAFFVVRLGLRPLDRIEATAGEIAAGQLSQRVETADPRTEVGRLGLALNRMLDRLEQAFAARAASEERLRTFLADASHELRTPLAAIRGYAELFRIGASASARDTELAMRRIEEEAKRMGVLVEDLLTLARLDEEPEPRRTPVDVARMARDVAADARATAPERTITVGAPDTASVLGDPHQLHQVLANLMRNALVHTPPSSSIEVTVAAADGAVSVSVRDHGPGLPDDAGEHLFERFWRAEGGRERGRGGAGLGLAIVREVLAAHGGEIRAENAPGGGALFTLRLPSAPSAAPAAAPV